MKQGVFAGFIVAVVAVFGTYYWFSQSKSPTHLRPDDPKIVAQGKILYAAQCASCHGKNLEGQPNWQQRKPDGKLPAPPHDISGHTWHHPEEMLIDVTKYGVGKHAGPGYKTDMPIYDGVLTDDEIVAVLSYVKSTWPAEIRAQHDLLNSR